MVTATAFSSGRPLTPKQEEAFFSALRLGNGTFKTTAPHRLDDLNAFVIGRWRQASFQPREIMDVGVSSGITSAEWLDALSRAGFQVRMTATDLALWGKLVPLWPGVSALEAGGEILQHILFGLAVRPWPRRLDYVTGYALVSALANRIATRRLGAIKGAGHRILLVSGAARQHRDIEWAEDDVLAPNPAAFAGRFDAIRAANLLNRDYFGPDQLSRAVANLKDRLSGESARLIVDRTLPDRSNHATLFRLGAARRFAVEARLGHGSEIEDIVLAT